MAKNTLRNFDSKFLRLNEDFLLHIHSSTGTAGKIGVNRIKRHLLSVSEIKHHNRKAEAFRRTASTSIVNIA